jgi:hypothetical protein
MPRVRALHGVTATARAISSQTWRALLGFPMEGIPVTQRSYALYPQRHLTRDLGRDSQRPWRQNMTAISTYLLSIWAQTWPWSCTIKMAIMSRLGIARPTESTSTTLQKSSKLGIKSRFMVLTTASCQICSLDLACQILRSWAHHFRRHL